MRSYHSLISIGAGNSPTPSPLLGAQIEKLLQQAADKEKELLVLLELTPIQIWNTDLDRFLEEWDVRLFIYFWHIVLRKKICLPPFYFSLTHAHAHTRQKACREWEDKSVVDSNGKKVKRKQATLKTRKSIGSGKRGGGAGGDSGGDDDFMPTKKAAAAKARKPVAPAAGASRARPKAKASDDDDRMSLDDDDDDEPAPPPPKKRAAPAKKPPPKIESDSDVEVADRPPPPTTTTNKPPAVKGDEDSGDDLVREALEKGKGKGKAAQTGKRKSYVTRPSFPNSLRLTVVFSSPASKVTRMRAKDT